MHKTAVVSLDLVWNLNLLCLSCFTICTPSHLPSRVVFKSPATAATGSPADHGPLPGQGRFRQSLQQQQQQQRWRAARALSCFWWPIQHREGLRIRGRSIACCTAGSYRARVGVGGVGGGGGSAQDGSKLLHRRWVPHVRRGDEEEIPYAGVLVCWRVACCANVIVYWVCLSSVVPSAPWWNLVCTW